MECIFGAMGLSAAGPIANGTFAMLQSAAMGGQVAGVMVSMAMPQVFAAVGIGLGALAVGLVVHEYLDAQKHAMGEPTPEHDPKHTRYVIVTHNWGWIEFRDFATFDTAIDAFRGGRKLRRILLRLNPEGEPDKDNGHGWRLPWDELAHDGYMPVWDNGLRWNLLRRLGRA